ncbi:MAG: GNAT family N-acetyltransferase [Pseudomonadota bacterium]
MTGGPVRVSVHDQPDKAAAAIVDNGLGEANELAAPLDEVRPLQCFVRDGDGRVLGGAVGRTWGECCELLQLWVEPAQRQRGLGSRLMQAFEQRAVERGCRVVYLDTFTFQAPAFYRRHGYEPALEIAGFGHGIVKYTMQRRLGPA